MDPTKFNCGLRPEDVPEAQEMLGMVERGEAKYELLIARNLTGIIGISLHVTAPDGRSGRLMFNALTDHTPFADKPHGTRAG